MGRYKIGKSTFQRHGCNRFFYEVSEKAEKRRRQFVVTYVAMLLPAIPSLPLSSEG